MDDQKLIQQVRHNHPEGIRALLLRYGPWVLRQMREGAREEDSARELTKKVFRGVIRSLKRRPLLASQGEEELKRRIAQEILRVLPAQAEEGKTPRWKAGEIVLVSFLGVLAGFMLWVLAGLVMSLGWIPQINLGYTWFSQHIYPLF